MLSSSFFQLLPMAGPTYTDGAHVQNCTDEDAVEWTFMYVSHYFIDQPFLVGSLRCIPRYVVPPPPPSSLQISAPSTGFESVNSMITQSSITFWFHFMSGSMTAAAGTFGLLGSMWDSLGPNSALVISFGAFDVNVFGGTERMLISFADLQHYVLSRLQRYEGLNGSSAFVNNSLCSWTAFQNATFPINVSSAGNFSFVNPMSLFPLWAMLDACRAGGAAGSALCNASSMWPTASLPHANTLDFAGFVTLQGAVLTVVGDAVVNPSLPSCARHAVDSQMRYLISHAKVSAILSVTAAGARSAVPALPRIFSATFSIEDPLRHLHDTFTAMVTALARIVSCSGASVSFTPTVIPAGQRTKIRFAGICDFAACCIGSICSSWVMTTAFAGYCYSPIVTTAGVYAVSLVSRNTGGGASTMVQLPPSRTMTVQSSPGDTDSFRASRSSQLLSATTIFTEQLWPTAPELVAEAAAIAANPFGAAAGGITRIATRGAATFVNRSYTFVASVRRVRPISARWSKSMTEAPHQAKTSIESATRVDPRRCCRPVAVGMPLGSLAAPSTLSANLGSVVIDVLGRPSCFSASQQSDPNISIATSDEVMNVNVSWPLLGSSELGCTESRYLALQCYTAAANLDTPEDQLLSSSLAGSSDDLLDQLSENLAAVDPLFASPFLSDNNELFAPSPVDDAFFMGSGDVVFSNTPRSVPNPLVSNNPGATIWSVTKRRRIRSMTTFLVSQAGPWSTGMSLQRIIQAVRHAGLASTYPSELRTCRLANSSASGNGLNAESPVLAQFASPFCYYYWSAAAKDAGPYLVSSGFDAVVTDWYLSNALVGDVVIFPALSIYDPVQKVFNNYPKGHIAMKFNESGGLIGESSLLSPDWVSDFLHSKMVYEHVYDSVENYQLPMLYRLRDDAQIPPARDEVLLPIFGVETIVGNPLLWTQLWAKQDAYETPVGMILDSVGSSWRCPASNNATDGRSVIMPQELVRIEHLPLELAKVANQCFQLLPAGSVRRYGVRCCYNNNGLYLVQYPSMITYAPSDGNDVAMATNAESISCWSQGMYSAPCAVFRSRRPAPPATNTPFSPPMKWSMGLKMAAAFGDPHCMSVDGAPFECQFQGEVLWTACSNLTIHLVGEQGESGSVTSAVDGHESRKNATIVSRIAVRYFTDTAIVFHRRRLDADSSSNSTNPPQQQSSSEMLFADVFLNGMPVSGLGGSSSSFLDVLTTNDTITIVDVDGGAVRVKILPLYLGMTSSLSQRCRGDPTLRGLAVSTTRRQLQTPAWGEVPAGQPPSTAANDTSLQLASRLPLTNETTETETLPVTQTHQSASASMWTRSPTRNMSSTPSRSFSRPASNTSRTRTKENPSNTRTTGSRTPGRTATVAVVDEVDLDALVMTANNDSTVIVDLSPADGSAPNESIYENIVLSYLVETYAESIFPPPLFVAGNYSFVPEFPNATLQQQHCDHGQTNASDKRNQSATVSASTTGGRDSKSSSTTSSRSHTAGLHAVSATLAPPTSNASDHPHSQCSSSSFSCPNKCGGVLACCYDAYYGGMAMADSYATWQTWFNLVRFPIIDLSSQLYQAQAPPGPVFLLSPASFAITMTSILTGTNFTYEVQDNSTSPNGTVLKMDCSVCHNPKVAACKLTRFPQRNVTQLYLRLVGIEPMTITCFATNALNQTSFASTTIYEPLSVNAFSTPTPTKAPGGVAIVPLPTGTYPPLWTPSPASASARMRSTEVVSLIAYTVSLGALLLALF